MEKHSVVFMGTIPSRIFQPLNHYDYGVLDEFCACPVCQDWRQKQITFMSFVQATWKHQLGCKCDGCQGKMRTRSLHLAALNRRDLYCEASWHASQITDTTSAFDRCMSQMGSGLGLHFMTWLRGQFCEKPEGWWVITAPYRAISDWIDDFSLALELSGIGYKRPFELASPIL